MRDHRNSIRFLALTSMLALAVVLAANAQQQPTDALAEQKAGLARQDDQMRQAGWEVMYMMDFGQMGEIWDAASEVMKRLVAREEFVRQIVTERARLGSVVERSRPEITRSASDGRDSTPAGLYLNVMSTTRFAHESKPVKELVSFRYDEDQTWRVTGYSLQ